MQLFFFSDHRRPRRKCAPRPTVCSGFTHLVLGDPYNERIKRGTRRSAAISPTCVIHSTLGTAVTPVPSFPIGSVAIPAHNEAAVIRRTLDELLDGFAPGELDVVVVCNGCTDDTAGIVRLAWPSVRVIEITQASKPAALRAADETLSTFPRIYLDADVILSAPSARLLIQSLRTGSVMAARLRCTYDTSRSDVFVRSYYRARERVQSGRSSLWGGGVYGFSQAGRSRFSTFPDLTAANLPDLIADDLFADQWFSPSEIEIVDAESPAIITVPRRIRDLFRVVRRRRKGNVDIYSLPNGPRGTSSSTVRILLSTAASRPAAVADTLFFFAFATIVRISVAISPPAGWSRDDSSRAEKTKSDVSEYKPIGRFKVPF